ncbi:hypothetical protein MMC26_006792 [Xylographa opegraphella]|nr:hypothetical protein [Xylographa opegraphella]
MDSSYPEEVRKYYAEAQQNETQPAVHLFWMNWMKWYLGDMMTVEEEDIDDVRAQGSGRRAFKISWNGKVQMTGQTSTGKDADAEVMAAQTAQYHLDMGADFQIFVLDCRGTKCNVLRMWMNAGESEWEVAISDIELPEDHAKLGEAFHRGFRHVRIPNLEKRINP